MTVPSSQNTPETLPDRMSELLLAMVEKLVDDPDSLHVDTDTNDAGTTFRLYVAPDDLGKVIGKQGRTARSLRTILSAIGSKANHRMQLDVLEDDEADDFEDDEEGSDEAAED
ncbi:KH domain-containing protein [Terriglobus aquaticus]|uniref:RNA-binding protein KhpA n=1 Tax=Terriglobus aquaticus TaxID=940139 RepID=A0ABW9KI72_9BACT|nr:KH domain-containing protein [Terriglobus aquaticus]